MPQCVTAEILIIALLLGSDVAAHLAGVALRAGPGGHGVGERRTAAGSRGWPSWRHHRESAAGPSIASVPQTATPRIRYDRSSSAPARTRRAFFSSPRDCCTVWRRPNQVLPHGLYTEMTVATPS